MSGNLEYPETISVVVVTSGMKRVPESEFCWRLRLVRIELTSGLEWVEEDEVKEEEWGLNLVGECERKGAHRFRIMW